MAKITFASLKLKLKDEIKMIKIGEKEIEVKQYLPSADKNSILELTIQKASEGTVINTFAIDAFFHLFIIFEYTNLTFTDTQKEDLLKLYDLLESNGIINEVISAIPQVEYKTLRDNLLDMVKEYSTYRNSARAIFEQISSFAPAKASEVADVIDKMDLEKAQNVLALANATGMNN